ncbi:MAG: hypothetical protein K0Q53_2159 [Massilibacillus sp.]|jgi:hypothetical protein|nr:hypothetical protein [Massilibacillus sp.]
MRNEHYFVWCISYNITIFMLMKGRSELENKDELLNKTSSIEQKNRYCEDDCFCPKPSPHCQDDQCTCPKGSCTCPVGSCTCPEGACPQTVELVQNPSFEIPCPVGGNCNVFANWTGTNIAADTLAPLTGNVAAELGAAPATNATLTQTINGLTAGCPYKFSFSVNAQGLNNANGFFAATALWQPGNNNALDNTTNPIRIDERFSGNNYVFIQRITNIAPIGTMGLVITFTKTGTGSVLVDDVSLYR